MHMYTYIIQMWDTSISLSKYIMIKYYILKYHEVLVYIKMYDFFICKYLKQYW